MTRIQAGLPQRLPTRYPIAALYGGNLVCIGILLLHSGPGWTMAAGLQLS